MASLDGRIVVGFKEDVPLQKIEDFLSTFVKKNAERFIDITNIEHVRSLLEFLPQKYLKILETSDGYSSRILQLLAEMALERDYVTRVGTPIDLIAEAFQQREPAITDAYKGIWETKRGKRVYVIRGLLNHHITPSKRGPEPDEEVSTLLEKKRMVTFVHGVRTIRSAQEDEEHMIQTLAEHYILTSADEKGTSARSLQKRFPGGIPQDFKELQYFPKIEKLAREIHKEFLTEMFGERFTPQVRDNIEIPMFYRRLSEVNIALWYVLNQKILGKDNIYA